MATGEDGAFASLPTLEPELLFSLSTNIGSSGSDSSPSQDIGRGAPLLAVRSSRMFTPFVRATADTVFSMFDSSVSDSSDSSIFGTAATRREAIVKKSEKIERSTAEGRKTDGEKVAADSKPSPSPTEINGNLLDS
uniref:Uncharacterized protein n=1 Tax=Anopheles atroparvus TaxID=41427 RepID=A0A182IJW0_ANOAO